MHSTGISRYPKQQKCFVQGKWLQWNMFLWLAQTCVIHNSQFGKKGCFSYLNFEIYYCESFKSKWTDMVKMLTSGAMIALLLNLLIKVVAGVVNVYQ